VTRIEDSVFFVILTLLDFGLQVPELVNKEDYLMETVLSMERGRN
jgi:uncharacterized membrane protein